MLCTSSLPNTVFLCELTSVGHAESLSTLLSLHTTQHLPCTLCAVRPQAYPPDTSTTSSNHSRIKNLKLSPDGNKPASFHKQERRPSWPSGAKPSYVWLYTHVLRRISSAKSITVKQVPKDPFRRHLQKVRWRGLSRRWTSSRFDSAVRRRRCGMLDGRGIRESRRGYVGYATWTSGDVAS